MLCADAHNLFALEAPASILLSLIVVAWSQSERLKKMSVIITVGTRQNTFQINLVVTYS